MRPGRARTGSRASSARHCACRPPDGRLAGVLFGWGDRRGAGARALHLGDFARSAPPGTYRLATPLDPDAAEEAALGWRLGRYRFDRYKPRGDKRGELLAPEGVDAARLDRIAEGVFLDSRPDQHAGQRDGAGGARGRLPRARGTGTAPTIAVTVGDDLLAANFPMIHAVGRAGGEAPRLIEIGWGDPGHPKVTLVGKGVCFDTGGLDLKPAASMALMKKDMGGAATVLGLAHMVMALRPAGAAARADPGGRELGQRHARCGRATCCARASAGRSRSTTPTPRAAWCLPTRWRSGPRTQPALMLDLATLTGAARVALGPDVVPFYTDEEALAGELAEAGRRAADPLWRLPLWPGYEREIEPHIADLDNAPGGGMAGSITAALFLKRFVGRRRPGRISTSTAGSPKPRPGRPKGGESQAARAVLRVLEDRFGGCRAEGAHERRPPPDAGPPGPGRAPPRGPCRGGALRRPDAATASRRHSAPLRAASDPAAAWDTELLHGEEFAVYEVAGRWAWGQAALDGYVGYLPAERARLHGRFRRGAPADHRVAHALGQSLRPAGR